MVNGRAVEKLRKGMGYQRQFLGIIVGLLPFLPGCSGGNNNDSPQVSVAAGGALCAESVWLVGSVDPQKDRHLSHAFIIQNQTDAPIPIKDIKSDCGCVVAKDRPTEIPAHESIGIPVSFSVPPVPGPFSHTVVVKLGLSEPAILPLKIHGIAAPTPALFASPSTLNFGTLSAGEKRTRTIQVRRYDYSSVEISDLKCDLEGCVLDSKPMSDSDAIIVSVTLDGTKLRPGANVGVVEVNTGHSGYPSLQFQVKADVTAITEAFVSSLTDSLTPGASITISLYRSSRESIKPPPITKLGYTGDPAIRVELLPPGGQHQKETQLIQLSLSGDAEPGVAKKGVIRIGIADCASANIEVPIIVFVR